MFKFSSTPNLPKKSISFPPICVCEIEGTPPRVRDTGSTIPGCGMLAAGALVPNPVGVAIPGGACSQHIDINSHLYY